MIQDRRILTLFLINWSVGVALGLAFAFCLLWFDVGGLTTVLRKTDMVVPGVALLFGGFAFTCGGVVCGSAVMFQAGRDGGGPAAGLGAPETAEIRVPVRPAR